ncbi:hypothetical protein ACQUW5_09730 [Legionella sp. CNM-1927-20]|uniref:hypothetical protein n=1 Tax=Legionella sp. CNM-1927-20 TaxID=3422221 RepID=UPI00403B0D5C
MNRTLEDLESKALKFWPIKLSEKEKSSSIIPALIETQDKFISLLNLADKDPFAWKQAITLSKIMHANLFLKHLMVLADLGGEKLMRLKKELLFYLPGQIMKFTWNGTNYEYLFKSLNSSKTWSNTALKVDGVGLLLEHAVTPAVEDVINLILFGGLTINANLPQEVLDKCIIGTLIGENEKLEDFVKQRYIWVSRITGGATANALGNLAQAYVIEYLQNKLPNWNFGKKTIPGISQNARTLMACDIVAESPKKNYCAIEVSFQVTTNSVIERKAGQARARQINLHNAGHKIAYIIDGAGNFERASALKSIIEFSDFTGTLRDDELDGLCDFLLSIDEVI